MMSPPMNALNVPHKIILIEDKNLACVADREHGRIQCFETPNGHFRFQLVDENFGNQLFSIAYSPCDSGILYAVNGASNPPKPTIVFAFNLTSKSLINTIKPISGVIRIVTFKI